MAANLLLVIGLTSTPAQASYDSDDTIAAIEENYETNPDLARMTHRIMYCECSNRAGLSATYNPNVNTGTYLGCGQLMVGNGNGLSIFYSWGYTDPYNPQQVVQFINEVQQRGMLASQYPRTRLGCQGSP